MNVKKVFVYDTKPYDKIYFEKLKDRYNLEFIYLESKLNYKSVVMAKEADAIISFVNDTIDKKVIDALYDYGIKVVALRCSGYNHVDLKYAKDKVHILRVPAYSPHAIAEHTMGMILTLNRKLNKAYNRTRECNFSLNGLIGMDLFGKTVGVIGTGKIGKTFIDICKGFGMRIIAYDLYPSELDGATYVDLDIIWKESDVISLHCPLTKETKYIINKNCINKMKDGVIIINTSRGGLINSEDLVEGLKDGKIMAAGLDVYEEESDFFFEDYSDVIIKDDLLSRLVSMPNVFVTSHQAYLTHEALYNIAEVTCENLYAFFNNKECVNEISA